MQFHQDIIFYQKGVWDKSADSVRPGRFSTIGRTEVCGLTGPSHLTLFMAVRRKIAQPPFETGTQSREGPTPTWTSTMRNWRASLPANRLIAAADPRLQQKRSWILWA